MKLFDNFFPLTKSVYSSVASVAAAAAQNQTTSSGVKCYVCSGTEECSDKFSANSDLEQDCSEDNGCSKIKQKSKLFGDSSGWVTTSKTTLYNLHYSCSDLSCFHFSSFILYCFARFGSFERTLF